MNTNQSLRVNYTEETYKHFTIDEATQLLSEREVPFSSDVVSEIIKLPFGLEDDFAEAVRILNDDTEYEEQLVTFLAKFERAIEPAHFRFIDHESYNYAQDDGVALLPSPKGLMGTFRNKEIIGVLSSMLMEPQKLDALEKLPWEHRYELFDAYYYLYTRSWNQHLYNLLDQVTTPITKEQLVQADHEAFSNLTCSQCGTISPNLNSEERDSNSLIYSGDITDVLRIILGLEKTPWTCFPCSRIEGTPEVI